MLGYRLLPEMTPDELREAIEHLAQVLVDTDYDGVQITVSGLQEETPMIAVDVQVHDG